MNTDKLGHGSPHGLPFMPEMVDGEILYSWACHFHLLSGNRCPNITSMQLFGDSVAGFRLDLPSSLNHFCSVSNGEFGDAEKLAYERSLLGFFAPFQLEKVVTSSIEIMKGVNLQNLKSELGILGAKFGASHQLKACQDCMKEDIEKYSISKWYLQHQWPASWVCLRHGRILNVAKREVLPRNRHQFLLPQNIVATEWECLPKLSTKQIAILYKMAEFCSCLSTRRNFHFDREVLRYTYRIGARNRGWVKIDGSMKTAKIWNEFKNYYSGLEGLSGFYRGNLNRNEAHFVSMLLNKPINRQHPIRHFMLMAFLFDSYIEFETIYKKVKDSIKEGGVVAVENMLNVSWQAELRRLLEIEKLSIKGACKALNIKKYQANYYVKKDKININKPLFLDANKEKELLPLILAGVDRNKIQSITGISETYLCMYLSKRTKLRDEWRKANHEFHKNEARAQYLQLVMQHPIDSIKKLEKSSKSKFNWLRSNDFKWLVENSSEAIGSKLRAGHKSKTDA
jgi:hypothetical protein